MLYVVTMSCSIKNCTSNEVFFCFLFFRMYIPLAFLCVSLSVAPGCLSLPIVADLTENITSIMTRAKMTLEHLLDYTEVCIFCCCWNVYIQYFIYVEHILELLPFSFNGRNHDFISIMRIIFIHYQARQHINS